MKSNAKYMAALEAKLSKLGGRITKHNSNTTFGSGDLDSPRLNTGASGQDLFSIEGQNSSKVGLLAKCV